MQEIKISSLIAYAESHPGFSGKNNEDRFGIFPVEMNGQSIEPSLLAVVADGIGGHSAGEIAAELVVKTIHESLLEYHDKDPIACLDYAFSAANRKILACARDEPATAGMGSTCACVWVIENRLYLASVGDSRIYLIRNGSIRQLTRDHTWIQNAIETGRTTREYAHKHFQAHVILRYLGSEQKAKPDFSLFFASEDNHLSTASNQGLYLEKGDGIYLCTDGLTDLVDPEEILDFHHKNDLKRCISHLVDLANQRGGHDNITVLGIRSQA